MKAAYEDRLAEARARLDEAAWRGCCSSGIPSQAGWHFRSLRSRGRHGLNSAAQSLLRSPRRNRAINPWLLDAKPRPPTLPTRSARSGALGPLDGGSGQAPMAAARAYAPLPEPGVEASGRQASSDR